MTKMNKPVIKKYKIILKTGLHIGAGKGGLKIGGIDASVVKHPLTGEPYIPGSSIKGRMRALLEMKYGDYSEEENNGEVEYGPSKNVNSSTNIVKAFGCATKSIKIASRLLVGDFVLTKEYREKFKELKSDFFEDKSENSVPRFLKGNANPRHIERVPAGVEFEGEIVLVPVEGENGITEEELKNILKEGIDLLNSLGLGGGVSRGNGRIEMKEIN